jgi:hypothetical protein
MWWRRLRYLLLLGSLCAIATCPSAKRACTANTRSKEAGQLLDYLADRVAQTFAATGKLPATPAGPTPTPGCCEQGGGECTADPSLWTSAGWHELGFSIDDPFRYTYEYAPDPSGTFAILRATGDLDCDEKKSLYEVKLAIVGTKLVRTWTRKDPSE